MAYNTDIETGAVKDGTLYWTTKDVNPCGTCSVEKIEPEIHIVGYGCLTPKHIKSNIKRYLSELEDCSKDYENQFDNINRLAYLLQAHTESLHAYENFGRGIENIDAFNFKNPFEGKHPFDYTPEDHKKWAKIKAEIEVA